MWLDRIINVDYRQRMGEQVDARTAAGRLGVDVRTLYAYVSRGALRRVPGPDGRSSRYDSDELELLARRSRPRTLPRPAASIDLVVATRVSTVTDGAVRYRGRGVLGLVADGSSSSCRRAAVGRAAGD
jgi:citrate synthase